MRLNTFLPGMGDPNKNAGTRRRLSALAMIGAGLGSMVDRTMLLPRGTNALSPKGREPSKFARAHQPNPGRYWEDWSGKLYQWQEDGSVRLIGRKETSGL